MEEREQGRPIGIWAEHLDEWWQTKEEYVWEEKTRALFGHVKFRCQLDIQMEMLYM